ncbi:beta-alanine transporter isoform X1 [Papilio machaon]|uniref:beta-alanine transporter isoform X1 n=1 Tax=Papilio machaon TaxID=76193 RepID=UPI001E662B2E|nr:beta-alanine transporter isoform X1 [Papilio machaon]
MRIKESESIGMEEKEQMKKKEAGDSDALENVLYHVGGMGLYQRMLFLSMLPVGIFFAFIYFGQMFITATPQQHWCHVPELAHLDMETRRNLSVPRVGDGWVQCAVYAANWSLVLHTMQPPEPSTPTVPCQNGWDFQLGDIPYHTVVSERGWVCEYSGYAPLAQTIYFVGSLVGGIFFGWMADRFGRVPALVGTHLVACVGGLGTIYTTDIWDFIFCRFLVGMAFDNNFMMLYILVLEYVGPRHRTWVASMATALFFGGGCLLLPWIAYFIADWRKFLWATSLPMAVCVFVPFVIPESARWLASRGKVNQAVKILKRIEKINGTKIPQDVMDEFIVSSSQTRQSRESLFDLFRSGPLRNMIIFMVVIYMACAMMFDGLVRMSEGLGLDFFITFTLTSATEIPSVTFVAIVLDRWGRRKLTIGPIVTAGTFTLIAAFLSKGVPQVTLAIASRFMINMSYTAIVQWSAELVPTGARASGSALIHVSGYIATMMSPFIVYSERFWSSLPLLILGGTALLASSFAFLLPETMGRPMPQTIVEGEKFVMSHTVCGKAEDEDELKYEKQKALIT